MISKLFDLIGGAFVYACAATVIAQLVILAALSRGNALSAEKLPRYAAAIYGFDLDRLEAQAARTQSEADQAPPSRDSLLGSRIAENPTIQTRRNAIQREGDRIHTLTQHIKLERERHEMVKRSFDDLLKNLEEEANQRSLTQVRRTLEVLQPKQAKELVLRMLDDAGEDPDDDVTADVIAILKALDDDKRKKLFGQFKTDEDRQQLHNILAEISELGSR